MRKVAIIGIGQVPVREHWSESLRELAARAVLSALDDAARRGRGDSGWKGEQSHEKESRAASDRRNNHGPAEA